MTGSPDVHAIGDVSVVICAYTLDRWDDIAAAVAAVARQSVPPKELVLVSDNNPELARRADRELSLVMPSLRVIENGGEPGLSGARNTAIGQCGSDVIAFLDDDALPHDDWLEKMLEPFEDPDVWVTGGRSIPAWPDGRPAWFPAEFDWVVGSSHRGLPTQTAPVRNVIGCSMAFRREVFDLVGRFVEGIGRVGLLPKGCEETEICIRLQQARPATTVVYVPASIVMHRVSAARTRFRYLASRCIAEGISKAQISELIGHQHGTASERAYVAKVLPAGVLRYLGEALRGDVDGLRRAATVLIGLGLTTWGYLRSGTQYRVSRYRAARRGSPPA